MHLTRAILHRDRFPTEAHYPFNLEVLQQTTSIQLNSPVTFFVGENGSGKSTLLRSVCRRSGIHIWEGVARARHKPNPYERDLHKAIDLEWSNWSVPGSPMRRQSTTGYTGISWPAGSDSSVRTEADRRAMVVSIGVHGRRP